MTFKFKKGGSGVRNLKEGMNQGIEVSCRLAHGYKAVNGDGWEI